MNPMLALQEGESQLLIIIPPNTPFLQNPHAIRAIQLGPAAAVCPGNRQARTHASVMVLDDTPFCTANLNCQSICMWQADSSIELLRTLVAGIATLSINHSFHIVQLVMPGCCDASHGQHHMQ